MTQLVISQLDRFCLHCGSSLIGKRRHAVYCSKQCCWRHKDARLKQERWTSKLSAPVRRCLWCGKPIAPERRSHARFCQDDKYVRPGGSLPSGESRCLRAFHHAVRKARKKGAPEIDAVSRRLIYDRDNGMCHICGEPRPFDDFHLDHVVPLARGGTHTADNLAVACPSCNLSKGARTLERQMTLT